MRMRQLMASGRARTLREAAGLSQAEIGARCGVVPSAVTHWEANDRQPRGQAAVIYTAILLALIAAGGDSDDPATGA